MKAFICLMAIMSSVSAGVLSGVDLFRGYYSGGAQQEFPSISNGVPLQTLVPPPPPPPPSAQKQYQSQSSVAPIIRLLQGPLSSQVKSLNIVNSPSQQQLPTHSALKTLKLIRSSHPQEAIKSIQLIRQIPELQTLPVTQEDILPGLQGVQILQEPTDDSIQLFETGYAPEPKSLQILQSDMPQRIKTVQLLQPGPVEELKTLQFLPSAPKITGKALQLLQPSNPGVEIQAIRILKQSLSPDISHIELVRQGETILGDENSFQILK